jgi:hypothetical protein
MTNTDDPNQLLRREALAEDLRSLGYGITGKTLATMASRGGGPPYQLFGRIPHYRRGTGRAWADARLTSPRNSTSEHDRLSEADKPGITSDGREP